MGDWPDDGTPDVNLTRAEARAMRSSETIGPYRLLTCIGEGGMGEVWLAEQTHPVRRQVAVKVIKAGMDTAHVVARFEAERQALALMSHPSIAQVYDAGATPQGRPYFAMEYVRGEAINAYCDRHHLSTRQRIDLFLDVCEGVQHAHQKGVIHRDLKPSNVLVTVQGDRAVPKIIDFGVAKAATQPLTARTLYTELGAVIGTPEYMSPEQAEMTGGDVDTRTDVYALGVMLYELLTGLLPFDAQQLRSKGLDEIRRTIREVDPPRPSTRLKLRTGLHDLRPSERAQITERAKHLRGDLDAITMRALEKDRTRRYAAVSDLAADLRRHLENLPVLATAPGTAYRVGKFVRRHRLGVTAAATLVLLLIGFAATMAVQARRIARERDRANVEAAASKQIADFLVGLFNVSDPNEAKGSSLTAREILDKGARDIDRTLAAQPQVRARLETTMGTVYTNLGLYRSAQPLLERAVATARKLLGERDAETLTAMNALANLYWYQGRYADAEPLYLAVVEGRRRTLGEHHPDTLRANYDLASLYMLEKRWDEASRLQTTTLEDQRRVLGDEHIDTLASMNNLASVYYNQRRYAEAQPLYLRALELARRVLGNDHPDTLNRMHNLATNYEELGASRDAERVYLEALAGRRRVVGEGHPETTSTERRLARFYGLQHRYDEAEPLILAAYRADLQSLGSESERTIRDVAQLVDLYTAWGKPAKAAEWRAKLKETGSKQSPR